MTWRTVLVALCCLSGCSPETSSETSQVADTTFVFSAEPVHDTATMREVLRIGVLEGEPEYMFSSLANFAVSPNGDVFIAELEGDVRQFDAEGTFVRQVARLGQGPGEVQYVVGMDVSADGRLALVDFGNQRVSVYSPEGEFMHQIRRPPGRPAYGRDAIQWDEDGELWIGLHPPRSGPDTLGARRLRPIYGRLVGDGEVVDTVYLPSRADLGCERRHHQYAGGYFEDNRIPFLPFAHWARARGDRLVFGCSAEFSFDIVEPDGGVTRVSRSWEPVEMTEAEFDFWSEYREGIARQRPAFLRLWLTDNGRVWAWPGAPGRSRESPPEARERGAPPVMWTYWSPTDGFDVFGNDGSWHGHVRTPDNWGTGPYPGNRDPQFIGDTVWGVTLDEFDASYVSKFVVEWPDSG